MTQREHTHGTGGIVFHKVDNGSDLPAPLMADRPLWTDDTRTQLLDSADAPAAYLVAAYAGSMIPGELVRDLDLEHDKDGHVQTKPAKTKQAKPAENKQAKPAATKSK